MESIDQNCALCGEKSIAAFIFKYNNIAKAYYCCKQHIEVMTNDEVNCFECNKCIPKISCSCPIVVSNGRYTIIYVSCSSDCVKSIKLKYKSVGKLLDICPCGKAANKKCAGCKISYYCSRECQKEDWKIHKLICKKE